MSDGDSAVIYMAGSSEAGEEDDSRVTFGPFFVFFSQFRPLTLTILCKRVKL